ncbi:TIGR04372 family glycosyltransferase [Magnetovibrio blakemorei]|uniref:Uncharacterized protein n=1 Tax=Magnetovibrio blakemorei TaxID=28181 RepID=A0A1E5Q6M6_9PROT|nr:TIGR04372 family glycosyltransferase [Magnetovibrio blakemorei]OEJ65856.1 hypothetical protein BEN30_13540 [Magnetovibrio blakemorei]OEJ66120.1 hypothetical protein BEN30_13010 [Magnetovibrio blakemorei]
MKILDANNTRISREFIKEAATAQSPNRLLELARDLRTIGRPDESFKLLVRYRQEHPQNKSYRFEVCLTHAALGNVAESLKAVQEIIDNNEANLALLLISALGAVEGIDAIGKPNVRSLLSETISEESQAFVFDKVPLKGISLLHMHAVINASKQLDFKSRAHFIFDVISRKCKYHIQDKIAVIIILFIRLILRRWNVKISSMGNFTRLADMVDRIDPVLRRFRDNLDSTPLMIVLYFGGYPNDTLMKLYSKHCLLVSPQGRLLTKLFRIAYSNIENVNRHTELTTDYRKINNDFLNGAPILSIPDADARRVEKKLRNIGINCEQPIICIGLRDMAYYNFYGTVMNVGETAQARNDTYHRCPPLSSYLETADYWAKLGYQVVRMGLKVSETLPKDRHPLIFDYAVDGRSDELDVHLFSRCHFMLAGDTGLFSGAAAFDRPAVVSDLFLIRNTIYSSNKKSPSIFIPKLVLDKETNNLINFSELIYFNHHFTHGADCSNARFELVHNDSEDIIAATKELSLRLSGRYEETIEDIALQKHFRDIYAPYHVGYNSTGYISSHFLRKYSHLL